MIFFFNDTATTEIYTLSLHDALPISARPASGSSRPTSTHVRPYSAYRKKYPSGNDRCASAAAPPRSADRKSTRLNSSHANISYAVFCLKKKNQFQQFTRILYSS